MKIALVNPPPCNFDEPQYDRPEFTRQGLACLAAYVREKGYGEILLIDAKYERLGYRAIKEKLFDFQPDVVGVTAFTNEIVQAGYVAALTKSLEPELSKKVRTVIGGVHVTAIPEQTMEEFPQFDFGVLGEGEETLLELLQHIDQAQSAKSIEEINGLIYPEDGNRDRMVKTGIRLRITDQSTLPMPAWDLFPKAPVVQIMSSRGCPFACNFCMNPNGKIVRKRAVEEVLKEAKWLLEEHDARHLNFGDEIFTIDKERAHKILDGLIELGFGKKGGPSFSGQTHVGCIDESLMKKIGEANCTNLGFGIESADPETLKFMGKGTNLKKIRDAVKLARKHKVPLVTYIIIGQPNETLASAWRSVWFAIRINPAFPVFGVMVPYPGTRVWEWAQKGERGYRLKSLSWNDYNKQIGNALELQKIKRWQIEILQLAAYCLVFLLNFRWVEFTKFVWRYRKEGVVLIKKIYSSDANRSANEQEMELLEFDAVKDLAVVSKIAS